VLDDPEVRRAAAKYGDPDELLREDWIPEFEEPGGRQVGPVQKCASLFSRHLLTVLDQAWAKSALDSFPLNSAQFWFHDRRASRARAVVLSNFTSLAR